MPLEFFCPNGHRIVCPEDRAGRDAKCPKCGVLLRVPNASGAVAARRDGSDAMGAPSEGEADNSRGLAPSVGENNIVFLCPNGHRLNGPARLQGQAGKCPHCGARFLVPTLAEMEAVEEVDMTDIADDDQGPLPMVEDTPPPSLSYHPLCKLVRKLWDEKEHGAVVELHLEGGAMLVPDWFDEKLSRQTHGLFATQAADGTVTMTVVAWDAISRVVVRNVEGLPDGMFE
jgi:DNA-directed RNA polymerase subunit RPC12/RpoP